jgi:prepilin-type N-terminal cleavage/methylation domain-containing protein
VFSFTYAFYAAAFSLLIVIAVYDMRHKIIPDSLIIALGILAFLGLFFFNSSGFFPHIPSVWEFASGLFIALPFALFWLVSSGRWMGLGDAKLAISLGWLLGLSCALSGVVIAFWIGAIVGIALVIFSKKHGMKSEIPFAPYLVLGTLIAFLNFKFVTRNCQKGMTILELVVVLAIFAVLSTVAIFNFGTFQSKINITNLADDIALQVVQAQNAALSGLLPAKSYDTSWKPSYGVYFSSTTAPTLDARGANNENFVYFVNLNDPGLSENYIYSGANSCNGSLTYECMSKYTITNGNSISSLNIFYPVGSAYPDACSNPNTGCPTNLTITFARPSSGAIVYSSLDTVNPLKNFKYVEIAITSPKVNVTSTIDLYPSGRVQIN